MVGFRFGIAVELSFFYSNCGSRGTWVALMYLILHKISFLTMTINDEWNLKNLYERNWKELQVSKKVYPALKKVSGIK